MPRNPESLRIAITTGDTDGIGLEVTAKALNELGPRPGVQFVLWRGQKADPGGLSLLEKRFRLIPGGDSPDLWEHAFHESVLIDVRSAARPDEWVTHASLACMNGLCDALVTGPLSKTGMRKSGKIGHTELLARLTGKKELFMAFRGDQFSVILATGHVPVSRVAKVLSPKRLGATLTHAIRLRATLPPASRRKPIAVVGLNPHAGEAGLIGREETRWMNRVIAAWREQGVEGPLVPDAAFLPGSREKYAVFVCPYHDQGLIPFKMVHGFDSGVHITMGLPFVRTSVDHGTAKELFGLNQAKHGSMRDAIETAIRLAAAGNSQEG